MTRSNVVYLSHWDLPERDTRDWATAHELIAESGITYRQLDYWCRTDLLVTLDGARPGTGWVRRFPDEQVHRALVIRVLLDSGLTLPFIRERIDEFLTAGTVHVGDVTITLSDPTIAYAEAGTPV